MESAHTRQTGRSLPRGAAGSASVGTSAIAGIGTSSGDDLFASYTDLFDDVATQMRLFSGILILRRSECGGPAAVATTLARNSARHFRSSNPRYAGAATASATVHDDC